MPAIIVNLWWLLLGLLLAVLCLAIIALALAGALAIAEAVRDWKKNMGGKLNG